VVIYLHFFVRMSNHIPPSMNDIGHKVEYFCLLQRKNKLSQTETIGTSSTKLRFLATENIFGTHKN